MKKLAYLLILLALIACSGQPAETPTAPAAQPTNSLAEVATPVGTDVEEVNPTAQPTTESSEPVGTAAAAEPIDCNSPASPSPTMTEGPYYTPDTPERTSLVEPDMPGTRLLLTGYVLDTNCQPVANSWLDFWQADANGVYDNQGYILRGHQFTDENGRYQLETVIPGQYPGRTEHIHVKVKAPGGREVTTQLFFPGSTSNDNDRIFAEELLIKIVDDSGSPVKAEFNFIIETP